MPNADDKTGVADSSASILTALKTNHQTQYDTLMSTLFDRRSFRKSRWVQLSRSIFSYGWRPGRRTFLCPRTHRGIRLFGQRYDQASRSREMHSTQVLVTIAQTTVLTTSAATLVLTSSISTTNLRMFLTFCRT